VILKQFEFFEDIIEQKQFQLYIFIYIDVSELASRREKMMLQSYLKKLKIYEFKFVSLLKECISQNIVQQLDVETLRMHLMN